MEKWGKIEQLLYLVALHPSFCGAINGLDDRF
jgi:hypothetical protein